MKKLILLVTLFAILLLMVPTMVAGQDCCELLGCCRDQCCAEITQWYRVSYSERVESGYFTPWGTPMYMGIWTIVYVLAHDSEEAAESLGLRAGYSCWVGRAVGYSD